MENTSEQDASATGVVTEKADEPEASANDVVGAVFAAADKLDALRRLGVMAQKKASRAIGYYKRQVRSKRFFARGLRSMALGLGTLAGLVPLVLPIVVLFAPWPKDHLPDLLSLTALLAGLSVGCIAFDKLFGFSSAWMRFTTTQMDLRAKSDAFSIDWARECLRAGSKPTVTDVLTSLDVLAAFLASINEVVRSETQSWVAEFRGVLADLEKSVEAAQTTAAAKAAARGSLEVRVLDMTALDERKWTLQVGGQDPVERIGATSAVATDLAPGQVAIIVSAKVSGKSVSLERVANVEAGKVAVVELTVAPAPSDRTSRPVSGVSSPSVPPAPFR
jgi:hypothetical protein